MKILIFGFGYSATFLAAKLAGEGWQISGTSRDPEKRLYYKTLGYAIVDFAPEAIAEILPGTTHILISTAQRQNEDDPVLSHFLPLLEQNTTHLQWIGYLSTTGVYGDHQGNWVDEDTAITPTGWRAAGRFASENKWLDFGRTHNVPVSVFRLAGIYGPTRNALAQLRSGKAHSIYKQGQVFSRIHVEDIAATLMAALGKPDKGGVYNVCDDEAAPSHAVLEYAATLLEIPVPERINYAQATLSDMAKDFYANNRRVRNHKIKEVLGVQLHYPNYRLGLKALFHAGQY